MRVVSSGSWKSTSPPPPHPQHRPPGLQPSFKKKAWPLAGLLRHARASQSTQGAWEDSFAQGRVGDRPRGVSHQGSARADVGLGPNVTSHTAMPTAQESRVARDRDAEMAKFGRKIGAGHCAGGGDRNAGGKPPPPAPAIKASSPRQSRKSAPPTAVVILKVLNKQSGGRGPQRSAPAGGGTPA